MSSSRVPVAAFWRASSLVDTPSAASVHVLSDPASVDIDSSKWLLALPRGAYSAARTVQRTHIMDFAGHCVRTASSLAAMCAADSSVALADPRFASQDKLMPLVRPVCSVALRAYYAANPLMPATEETKVTWLAALDGTLAAHCSTLSAPGPSDPHETLALVAGKPRGNAAAKDTQWVRDRAALADTMKSAGANELLLTNDDGKVFEGLSSNAFVVYAAPCEPSGAVVRTAPLSDVLEGTVLKLVRSALKDMGVPLVFEHPRLAERSQWRAAFITSTSRLVCPLARVELRGEALVQFGGAGGAIVHLDPVHPVLAELTKRVAALVLERAERVLGEGDTAL